MSLILKNISYIHPDKEPLFEQISLTLNKAEKCSLIGKNGSGKSTLLKIISGILPASGGEITSTSDIYYIPQHFGQYNHLTIAGALQIEEKLHALQAILNRDTSIEQFNRLNDDWTIEERAIIALSRWDMDKFPLDYPLKNLSGGEKTKLFLAALSIHEPGLVLMDEPTNHLDMDSREKLYKFISTTTSSLLIVSHDITLLNLLPQTLELTKKGITLYGGNYDFYKEEKNRQLDALKESLDEKEKALRMAKKSARETAERKNKLDNRGKKLSAAKGISRMGMNTRKDKAEKSSSRLKDVHTDKIGELAESVKQLYEELPENKLLKVAFNSSTLHSGRKLVKAKEINIRYTDEMLWKNNLSFEISSGERILLKGSNGSGKTSLLKIITGQLPPSAGEIEVLLPTTSSGESNFIYIDQEYSLIQNDLSVYEQLQLFNHTQLVEHELKMLLARFLFPPSAWNKYGRQLSGGEKMRLLFCCLLTGNNTPDMILLDEPTNNLDIESMEIILTAIKEYKGTLLLISHDAWFIGECGIEKVIEV